MYANDVEFTLNSGSYKGDTYGFTLATVNGAKAWGVNPTFSPAPSMYNERIEMTIKACEHNVDASGAVNLRAVEKALTQLKRIAEAKEPTTLKAFGGEERIVRIDENGYQVQTSLKETGKQPEYHIKLSCWGMHKYGDYNG